MRSVVCDACGQEIRGRQMYLDGKDLDPACYELAMVGRCEGCQAAAGANPDFCNTCLEHEHKRLSARVAELEQRRDELLALVAAVSKEAPDAGEARDLRGQVAALIAEVGTLRAASRAGMDERAAIVAWLRRQINPGIDYQIPGERVFYALVDSEEAIEAAADAIGRGDHLKKETK